MTDEQMLGPTDVSFESPTGEVAVHDDWAGTVTVGMGLPLGEMYVLKNPDGTVTVQMAWEVGELWYSAGVLVTAGRDVRLDPVRLGPFPARAEANAGCMQALNALLQAP